MLFMLWVGGFFSTAVFIYAFTMPPPSEAEGSLGRFSVRDEVFIYQVARQGMQTQRKLGRSRKVKREMLGVADGAQIELWVLEGEIGENCLCFTGCAYVKILFCHVC